MSFSDIQGTPLEINLRFVHVDVDQPPPPGQPPPDHPLACSDDAFILAFVLSQLKSDAERDALKQLLTTPLDQSFATMWSQPQATTQSGEQQAIQAVQQAIQSARPNAYNINPTFPSAGTLRAQVGNLSTGMLGTLPPGTSGMQLTLSYLLPGVSVTWSETTSSGGGGGAAAGAALGGLAGAALGGLAGAAAGAALGAVIGGGGPWENPSYSLTFDGEIEIAVAVPDNTLTPLGAKAEFLTHNTQTGPGNLFAVIIGIEDLISAWLSVQPLPPPPSDQIVPIFVPTQLSTVLMEGFSAAAPSGFLQLGVTINPPLPCSKPLPPGNTVEFDVTHLFDPGPIVTNPLAPQGPSLVQPQIGTSAPTVNAGGQLGVIGSYFPAASSTQLTIIWTDTTSGDVVQSEIQWGAAPDNHTPPSQPNKVPPFTRHPYDNRNTYTQKGLTPNTWYAFRVRDYDVANFIATDWSAWTFLQTSATDQVQLALGDGNNTLIGFATLQTDGTFMTTGIVPQGEPPGTYELLAELSGHRMAQTPITVVAAGQPLQQVLQIINPDTGIAFTGTPGVVGRYPVTVRGSNFSPGTVNLFVDSTSGTTLGQFDHLASDTFTVTVTWPFGITGPHTIVAQQNALQATASVYGENPPT